MNNKVLKLVYGNGTLMTQQGIIEGEGRCLTITEMNEARPIGATQKDWKRELVQDEHDVILVFKNLEGARSFQDEINELCAVWSRDIGEKVTNPQRKVK